ncbi:unnamed protein product [Cuscuta campestris]|uniref:Uncharacterized protein n=1 Tax=Cuscuta campestris TaxID=132261 RepID=A0A484KP67_9ASTE|nr:unnamed protein product [Cuscuta campestris]
MGWGASVSDRGQGRGGRRTNLAFGGGVAGFCAAWGRTAGRESSGLGVAGGSFGSSFGSVWSREVGMQSRFSVPRPKHGIPRLRKLPFSELGDVLHDFERKLTLTDDAASTVVATAHATQRHPSTGPRPHIGSASGSSASFSRSSGNQRFSSGGSFKSSRRHDGSSPACHFCSIPGHDIKVCRKLARLLREHGMQTISSSAPAVHATTLPAGGMTQWMFDSGASHHTTPAPQHLQSFADYGGPDEIRLGNGQVAKVSRLYLAYGRACQRIRVCHLCDVLDVLGRA